MALDKIKLDQLDLNYNDVFKFAELYTRMHEWLDENGYEPEKYKETFHLERVDKNGSKEQWIWWRLTKDISQHFRYHLHVDFHTLGMSKVEVMHEGKKIRSNKGEVEVFIQPYLEIDPDDSFKKHPLLGLGFVKKRWLERIKKGDIDAEKGSLMDEAVRLYEYIKQYLELKVFLHEYKGKSFFPVKGH